ncbi:MAG: PEP-CTERM sorting domain-containing protein [Akkermansiaceae bacterium]
MKMNQLKTTISSLAAFALVTASAQAAIVVSGSADYSLSVSSASPFDDAGNIIDKAGITATGPSTNGATPDKLLDDAINKDFPNTMWYNNATGMVDVTFTFSGPVTLTGIKVDWAWGNTDDGTYDLRPNGASIGTYSVTGGGDFPARDPSHFLFDSAQTGVNTFILSIDAIQAPALAEVTFYGSAVPEPSTTALLGLGGLALILRRRK